jgi:dolichyl-phosphate beta-glucosyltransferase
VIGSREAPGAERTGEAWRRRVTGRVFNALVRLIAVPEIQDSQCGYKLLSADAVAALLPHLTIDGFAFDVELLFLARLAGFEILEVGITCHCRHDSRVRFGPGTAAVVDILRVNVNARRGRYAALMPAAPPEPVRHSG